MNLADEHWRHAILTHGPRGMWRTVPGTHTQLFDEAIRFDTDGSGEMRQRSVMSGETALKFSWRATAYGVIECQPVCDTPSFDDDGEPEASDWFRIRFEFRELTTDAGTSWVLQERDADGFWELTAPLVPAG
ncbi:MAG: hypothetical protein RLZZ618_904 [Pseudomonadota bacterium]|jgi:hypothetical protein